MTDIEIERFLQEEREIMNAATPGPWKYDCGNNEVEKEDDRFVICNFDWLHSIIEYNSWNDGKDPSYPHYHHDNGEFIAHVRMSHAIALDIIEKLQALLDEAEKKLKSLYGKEG